jgi:hypothetical protein
MTDPNTYTSEFRSFEWELVMQYEDGSLPTSSWNEATLGVVASWYAKNLTREQATTRYEQAYHKNHRRLTHRLDASAVHTAEIDAVDKVWQDVLKKALEVAGK